MGQRGGPQPRTFGLRRSALEKGFGGEVTVELFGVPRLVAGRKVVALSLGDGADLGDVVVGLANVCPALVGKAIKEDLSGPMDGYVLNMNGFSFVDRLDTPVRAGDAVLLLSDQAGG